MSNYILASDEKVKQIVEYSFNESYTFNRKLDKSKIRQITIYNSSKMQDLIFSDYEQRYQRFIQIMEDLFGSDDATDADFIMARDEAQKLKEILTKKYIADIKKEKYQEFLKNLDYFQKLIDEQITQREENVGKIR